MRYIIFSYIIALFACGKETVTNAEFPLLSVDQLTVLEGNDEKNVFVSLRLSKLSSKTVQVIVSTEDNTAISGEDYKSTIDTAIIFEPGDIQTSIPLKIIGDTIFEEEESFFVVIKDVTNAQISEPKVAITIENDDINTDIEIPTTGYMSSSSYPGKQLVWSQEFEEEFLDESVWIYEIGNGQSGWGNNELQYYRKDNTQLLEGNLVIQARKEPFGGFQYTSSRLITENKFEFTYGRIDVRAVVPGDQGIWPAVWLLGENIRQISWPKCGEIDILEQVGSLANTNHGTIHYSGPNGNRIQNSGSYKLLGNQEFSDAFHVYSLEWDEEKLQFFVDDNLYHTILKSNLSQANPYPFDEPFFFIANVAVGGNWPGSPDPTTSFPKNLIIDYIRVFQ